MEFAINLGQGGNYDGNTVNDYDRAIFSVMDVLDETFDFGLLLRHPTLFLVLGLDLQRKEGAITLINRLDFDMAANSRAT